MTEGNCLGSTTHSPNQRPKASGASEGLIWNFVLPHQFPPNWKANRQLSILLERRVVQDGGYSVEPLSQHFPNAHAQLQFLPIQRHCVKHSAIVWLAHAACAQHAAFLPQVKTPPGLAQSGGIAALGAILLSKSRLPVAR